MQAYLETEGSDSGVSLHRRSSHKDVSRSPSSDKSFKRLQPPSFEGRRAAGMHVGLLSNEQQEEAAGNGVAAGDAGRISALRVRTAFWFLGLCSSTGYVIMVAGAKEINSGGVGLVFLCDVAPGFFVKLSAPYWFHLVPHSTRVIACGVLMVCAFSLVGCGTTLGAQLAGVSLSSTQSALGETTFLSLAARYDSRWALTMWSSGTGFAGVFGYAYVYMFHVLAGFSFRATLLLANTLAAALVAFFFLLLGPVPAEPPPQRGGKTPPASTSNGHFNSSNFSSSNFHLKPHAAAVAEAGGYDFTPLPGTDAPPPPPPLELNGGGRLSEVLRGGLDVEADIAVLNGGAACAADMTFLQRVRFVGSLWPYMAPLCVVYFAEYCMQSGTWSAIGFPITSEEARRQFYLYANWMYQVGVFISRSSGILVSPPRWVLQLAMPAAQVTLLVFFYANATHHWWYDYTLLLPCLAAGLLGGGVYVGTFILLAHEAPRERRELALSAASIADTVGICFADVVGLVIQACVYKANGVPGATAQCPL